MSFDILKSTDVRRKTKEVKISVNGNDYTFFAKEITYLQRLHLASLQQAGSDVFSQLVVYSITDVDGKHMTTQQAEALAPEHAEILFVAASDVNKPESVEKN